MIQLVLNKLRNKSGVVTLLTPLESIYCRQDTAFFGGSEINDKINKKVAIPCPEKPFQPHISPVKPVFKSSLPAFPVKTIPGEIIPTLEIQEFRSRHPY